MENKVLYKEFYEVKGLHKEPEQKSAWKFYNRLCILLTDELDKHNDYTFDVALELLEGTNEDAEILAKEIKEQQ